LTPPSVYAACRYVVAVSTDSFGGGKQSRRHESATAAAKLFPVPFAERIAVSTYEPTERSAASCFCHGSTPRTCRA
jgi:hypothetical protein